MHSVHDYDQFNRNDPKFRKAVNLKRPRKVMKLSNDTKLSVRSINHEQKCFEG